MVSAGLLYYTDNCLNIRLAKACRRQLAAVGLPITSVSLKPLPDFGNNLHFAGERGVLTMFRQILAGLEVMEEEVIFLCEHDVLYHPSHFEFRPERDDAFYYNTNNWRVRASDGHAVYFLHDSTSQCCAYRELLLEEYRARVARVEAEGWKHGGYEPGTRSVARGGFSDRGAARWRSPFPNLDIRHDNNLTASRWSQSQFRDKSTCTEWQESTVDKLPGWEGLKFFGGVVPAPEPAPRPIFHPKPQPNGARDLAVLIPARNEMFLARTVQDLLEHKRANTEIVIGLDGAWAEPVIKDHPDVSIYHAGESLGQRAITNQCARLTTAKYVMKVDAHCAFAEGFDLSMLEAFEQAGDDATMVPTMRNLWAFDWECPQCGARSYQGPTPTRCRDRKDLRGEGCDNTAGFRRHMVWEAKRSPQSNAYCFDSEPHFQYFREFSERPEGQGDLTESMSLQGSCFMLTRERYWGLNICDETLGSWGSQGIEVACKSWLSGGRVLVNHRTWYAHLFRTQGGDFGFPYHNPGSQVLRAKRKARELFLGGQWPGRVRPLSWLLERFWPVPGWTQEELDKLKASET